MKVVIKDRELICQVCGGKDWESKHASLTIPQVKSCDIALVVKILECAECKQILWFNEGLSAGEFNLNF